MTQEPSKGGMGMRLNVIRIRLMSISRKKNGIIYLAAKTLVYILGQRLSVRMMMMDMVMSRKLTAGPARATLMLSVRGFLKFASLMGTGLNMIKGSLKAI